MEVEAKSFKVPDWVALMYSRFTPKSALTEVFLAHACRHLLPSTLATPSTEYAKESDCSASSPVRDLQFPHLPATAACQGPLPGHCTSEERTPRIRCTIDLEVGERSHVTLESYFRFCNAVESRGALRCVICIPPSPLCIPPPRTRPKGS